MWYFQKDILTDVHGGVKYQKRDYCEKTFKWSWHLKKHLKRVHEGVKIYKSHKFKVCCVISYEIFDTLNWLGLISTVRQIKVLF